MTQNLRGPEGAEKPKLSPEERKKRRLRKLRAKARTALNLWLVGDPGPTHAARFTATLPGVAGRGDACKMKIPDPDVSDKHAFFAKHDSGNWWVYDLGSRNGVIVNDIKVVARRLDAGDTVRLGGKSYKVELLKDAANWVIDEPRNRFELVKRIHSGTMGDLFLARWGGFDGRPVAVRVFPPEFDGNPEDIARFIRGSEKGGRTQAQEPREALSRRPHGGPLAWPSGLVARDGVPLRRQPPRSPRRHRRPAPGGNRGSLRHRLLRCPPRTRESRAGPPQHQPVVHLVRRRRRSQARRFLPAPRRGHRHDQLDHADEHSTCGVRLSTAGATRSEEGITPQADLYSLAACMYQALTLQSPFNGDQPLPQLIAAIRSAKVPRIRDANPAVPASLDELILRAMSRNPSDRPAGPRELKAMLAKI